MQHSSTPHPGGGLFATVIVCAILACMAIVNAFDALNG
jgi:hypothetical protein